MIWLHPTPAEVPTDEGLLRLFRELTPAERKRIVDGWRQRLTDRSPEAEPT